MAICNEIEKAISILNKCLDDNRSIELSNEKANWLALQLGRIGAFPSYPPDSGRSAEDVELIAKEWLAEAERVSVEKRGCQAN